MPPQSWSATLRLPKSTFPARVAWAQQAKYLPKCTDDLYAWQRRERPANNPFVLHDGPPYANGDLHIGHALNKILKDIICRVQLAKGKRVSYVPGWDCHGLPIEIKALQSNMELERSRAAGTANPVAIRKVARKLAEKTVQNQMKGFKSWGIMADWENSWKTMDKGFEINQLKVLRTMVEKGLIYRRYKPVYWSPSSGTALAEAELEYNEAHTSTAALVKFPLLNLSKNSLLTDFPGLSAVIWTTTPWTLPANQAIAVNRKLKYNVLKSAKHGHLLAAMDRIDYLKQLLSENLEPMCNPFEPDEVELLSASYSSHFGEASMRGQPLVSADFVTADSGSGLVHCAPGHGMEDYLALQPLIRSGRVSVVAPVDDAGRFTHEALPKATTKSQPKAPEVFAGKNVLTDGNQAVLDFLVGNGNLLASHKYVHKYPYDWRTKQPIIIRATAQWFADVSSIREESLNALNEVQFIPASGKSRLDSFVANRSEWCISRQRAWGVPIPAIYDIKKGEAIMSPESISHILRVIQERGIEAWWTDAKDEPAWILPRLQEDSDSNFQRGTDTLDVWFDSGTSWTTMLNDAMHTEQVPQPVQEGEPKPEKKALADVYVEGTDQHRGWFQSSLLTNVACQSDEAWSIPLTAPYQTLITHGFILDQDGRKMSKSLGNVVSPDQIMDGTLLPAVKVKGKKIQAGDKPVYSALGSDALRLWVASSDYTRDVAIGQLVLESINSALNKYRLSIRFILGALEDFDPATSLLPYDNLHTTDRIALLQLSTLNTTVRNALDTYEFHKAASALTKYFNAELSAFYVETIRDRLYADSATSASRLAVQTTLYHIYSHLLSILCPITPLLVEESWAHTPPAITTHSMHPLQRLYPTPPDLWRDPSLEADIPYLSAAHSAVKAAQEAARSAKHMGSSLQSFVTIQLPSSDAPSQAEQVFRRYADALEEYIVVSKVDVEVTEMKDISDKAVRPTEIHGDGEGSPSWMYHETFKLPGGEEARIVVRNPDLGKCARCWRYVVDERLEARRTGLEDSQNLCGRCEEVLGVDYTWKEKGDGTRIYERKDVDVAVQ